jgi:hypothetical protein
MNKTLLILQREYLTRVKKPSFIVMTFLGPLLMVMLMVVPIFLATLSELCCQWRTWRLAWQLVRLEVQRTLIQARAIRPNLD